MGLGYRQTGQSRKGGCEFINALIVRGPPHLGYLYTARAARVFGDGCASIVLPAYLSTLGLNAFQIGVVAAAALFGSAASILTVGLLTTRLSLRTLLLICS